MISATTGELVNQIGLLSYAGVWGVAMLSNVVIPVPEEVVLLLLGYVAAGPRFEGVILFPVVLSGLLISDIAMYLLAKKGNRLVSGFYNKVFARRIESKKDWIDRHINKVVFFSRFLVQLRFLGPFFAGKTKMSFRKFFFLDLFALLIYTPLYLLIGFYYRSRINFIIEGVNAARNIIIIIALSLLLISFVRFVRNRLLKIKLENSKIDDTQVKN